MKSEMKLKQNEKWKIKKKNGKKWWEKNCKIKKKYAWKNRMIGSRHSPPHYREKHESSAIPKLSSETKIKKNYYYWIDEDEIMRNN